MKSILLWDPRFPDRAPARLTIADAVASAAVRAGVAAVADSADYASLALGGAVDPTTIVEVLIENGVSRQLVHALLPIAVASVGIAAGVAAAIAGAATVPMPTPTPTPTPTPSTNAPALSAATTPTAWPMRISSAYDDDTTQAGMTGRIEVLAVGGSVTAAAVPTDWSAAQFSTHVFLDADIPIGTTPDGSAATGTSVWSTFFNQFAQAVYWVREKIGDSAWSYFLYGTAAKPTIANPGALTGYIDLPGSAALTYGSVAVASSRISRGPDDDMFHMADLTHLAWLPTGAAGNKHGEVTVTGYNGVDSDPFAATLNALTNTPALPNFVDVTNAALNSDPQTAEWVANFPAGTGTLSLAVSGGARYKKKPAGGSYGLPTTTATTISQGDAVTWDEPIGNQDMAVAGVITLGQTELQWNVKTTDFVVQNVWDEDEHSQYVSVSNNGLTLHANYTTGAVCKGRVLYPIVGKRIFALAIDQQTAHLTIGITPSTHDMSGFDDGPGIPGNGSGFSWQEGGLACHDGSYAHGSGDDSSTKFGTGDIIVIAVNTAAKKVWYGKPGAWDPSCGDPGATPTPGAGLSVDLPDYYAFAGAATNGDGVTIHTKDLATLGITMPTGFAPA